jgi:hypothetical protein
MVTRDTGIAFIKCRSDTGKNIMNPRSTSNKKKGPTIAYIFISLTMIISAIVVSISLHSSPIIVTDTFVHDAVVDITSDSALNTESISGNGSAENPYILSYNFTMNGSTEAGIKISGTTSHFVIKNTNIVGTGNNTGAWIESDQGGLIESSSFSNLTTGAYYLSSGGSYHGVNDTSFSNSSYGIRSEKTQEASITSSSFNGTSVAMRENAGTISNAKVLSMSNSFENTPLQGSFYSIRNVTVTGSTFWNATTAALFMYQCRAYVHGNTFANSTKSIEGEITDVRGFHVYNNSFHDASITMKQVASHSFTETAFNISGNNFTGIRGNGNPAIIINTSISGARVNALVQGNSFSNYSTGIETRPVAQYGTFRANNFTGNDKAIVMNDFRHADVLQNRFIDNDVAVRLDKGNLNYFYTNFFLGNVLSFNFSDLTTNYTSVYNNTFYGGKMVYENPSSSFPSFNATTGGNYWASYTNRYPWATNDGTYWNVPYMAMEYTKNESVILLHDELPLVNETITYPLESRSIFIENDTMLANAAIDGDGSAGNPYVLSYPAVKLNSTAPYFLRIGTVTKHFKITGCIITGSGSGVGIQLDSPSPSANVDNFTIERSTFVNLSRGIKARKSNYYSINYCNFVGNWKGIEYGTSDYVNLTGNYFDGSDHAIYGSVSARGRIFNVVGNEIKYSNNGIRLEGNMYATSWNVVNNTFLGINQTAIIVEGMQDDFVNNSFVQCGKGIDLYEEYYIITGNAFNGMDLPGSIGVHFNSLGTASPYRVAIVNRNNFTGLGKGIYHYNSIGTSLENIDIDGNLFDNNSKGIHFQVESTSYNITENLFIDNDIGAELYSKFGGSNDVEYNVFAGNDYCIHESLIGISATKENNVFVNNTLGMNRASRWNTIIRTPSNGTTSAFWNYNYWWDYTTKYPSATNDGTLWDTPYNVSTTFDLYPLVKDPSLNVNMTTPGTVFHGTTLPVTATVHGFEINTIKYYISNSTWNGTLGTLPVINESVDFLLFTNVNAGTTITAPDTFGTYTIHVLVNNTFGTVHEFTKTIIVTDYPVITGVTPVNDSVIDSGDLYIGSVAFKFESNMPLSLGSSYITIRNGTFSENHSIDYFSSGDYYFRNINATNISNGQYWIDIHAFSQQGLETNETISFTLKRILTGVTMLSPVDDENIGASPLNVSATIIDDDGIASVEYTIRNASVVESGTMNGTTTYYEAIVNISSYEDGFYTVDVNVTDVLNVSTIVSTSFQVRFYTPHVAVVMDERYAYAYDFQLTVNSNDPDGIKQSRYNLYNGTYSSGWINMTEISGGTSAVHSSTVFVTGLSGNYTLLINVQDTGLNSTQVDRELRVGIPTIGHGISIDTVADAFYYANGGNTSSSYTYLYDINTGNDAFAIAFNVGIVARIYNSTFTGNGSNTGILFTAKGDYHVKGCTFSSFGTGFNKTGGTYGLNVISTNIENNTFSNSITCVYIDRHHFISIYNNIFENSIHGVRTGTAWTNSLQVKWNQFNDVSLGFLQHSPVSWDQLANMEISGNHFNRSNVTAIKLYGTRNAGIFNNTINVSGTGIEFRGGETSHGADNLYNNTIENCDIGLLLIASNGFTVNDNTINNCTIGIEIGPLTVFVTGNVITFPSLVNGTTGIKITGNSLSPITSVVLTSNNITRAWTAIYLDRGVHGYVRGPDVVGAVINDCHAGIVADTDAVMDINDTIIIGCDSLAIKLNLSSSNLINNTFINNTGAIEITGNNINITGNVLENNTAGINVTGTSVTGIAIYRNSFLDSPCNDTGGASWNDTSDGNYWSDYITRYPSATSNGTHWDTPYSVDASFDYLPLSSDLFYSASGNVSAVGKNLSASILLTGHDINDTWYYVSNSTWNSSNYNFSTAITIDSIPPSLLLVTQEDVGIVTTGNYTMHLLVNNSWGSLMIFDFPFAATDPSVFDVLSPVEGQLAGYGTHDTTLLVRINASYALLNVTAWLSNSTWNSSVYNTTKEGVPGFVYSVSIPVTGIASGQYTVYIRSVYSVLENTTKTVGTWIKVSGPQVTIIEPAVPVISGGTAFNLTANVTDPVGISSVEYVIEYGYTGNWQLLDNGSMIHGGGATYYKEFSLVTINDDEYRLTVIATPTIGNDSDIVNQSTTVKIDVDDPSMSLVSNNTNITTSSYKISFVVHDEDLLENITIEARDGHGILVHSETWNNSTTINLHYLGSVPTANLTGYNDIFETSTIVTTGGNYTASITLHSVARNLTIYMNYTVSTGEYIIINNPLNGTTHSAPELDIVVQMHDPDGIASQWFVLSNGSGVVTTDNLTAGIGDYYNYSINVTSFSSGSYNLTLYMNDTLGLLTMDKIEFSIEPGDYIDILAPGPGQVITELQFTASVYCFDPLGVNLVWYEISNGSGVVSTGTFSGFGSGLYELNISVAGILDGNYVFNASYIDGFSNVTSATVNIVINLLHVTMVQPTTNGTIITTSPFVVEFFLDESPLTTPIVLVNGTPATVLNPSGLTFTASIDTTSLGDGDITIYIQAETSTGKNASVLLNAIINVESPSISILNFPSNGTIWTGSTVPMSLTCTDGNGITSVSANLTGPGGSTVIPFTPAGGGVYSASVNPSLYLDGNYTIEATATDGVGSTSSLLSSISIDTTSPSIPAVSIANSTIIGTDSLDIVVDLDVTVIDEDIDTVEMIVYNNTLTTGPVLMNPVNSTGFSKILVVENVTNGTYYINVTATSNAGINRQSTRIIEFTVLATYPSLVIDNVSIANGTSYETVDGDITVSMDANVTGTNITTIIFTVYNSTGGTVGSGTLSHVSGSTYSVNFTILDIPAGNYTIEVVASDALGQESVVEREIVVTVPEPFNILTWIIGIFTGIITFILSLLGLAIARRARNGRNIS